MSFGQLYVVWSTLCHLVKFFMSTGQLYVVWSSFICHLVNFMSFGQFLGLPLYNTRSEAGALPLEVRIENDSGRKFPKSKFKVFLETTFVHVSCYPDHHEPKIFFFGFRSPHIVIPFDTRF